MLQSLPSLELLENFCNNIKYWLAIETIFWPQLLQIKIVRNPGDDQRLAYVNFERPEAARTIRHTMLPRLQKLLGKRLHLDPAGIIRDQEGKYIPDRYNRALQAERERERKDPLRR